MDDYPANNYDYYAGGCSKTANPLAATSIINCQLSIVNLKKGLAK